MDRTETVNPFADSQTTRNHGELDEAFAALSDGWVSGKMPRAEQFAHRIASAGMAGLLELVYHEYCLADAMGTEPVAAEYCARFPQLAMDLTRLIELHGLVDRSTLHAWSPRPVEDLIPGDELGTYRLLREMGKGGLARVFLAAQTDLEDRLVVVKVAEKPSIEGVLLARTAHPHIVQVIRQAEGDGLYLIAMTFEGGTSLSAVLAESARRGGKPTGQSLLDALDNVAAREFNASEVRTASRTILSRMSHAQAVCWMIARLADALDHANRMGVTHGDLKPANILIAADGRPMLLDFNLSVDWRAVDAEAKRIEGGTLAYMAPERLRALAEPKSAPPTRPADRHRADLYSLGIVLREALSGRPPAVTHAKTSLLREAAAHLAQSRERAEASDWIVPGVPSSLRPVLAKLLAPDPADRYGKVSELAEDLDRWGADLPFLHASNEPGLLARSIRVVHRHRKSLVTGTIVLAATAGVAMFVTTSMNRRLRSQAEAKLGAIWDSGDPAIFRARRFGQWQPDENAAELARRNLDHYAVLGPEDWRNREDVRNLSPSDRDDLEMWLMEQTWRLAAALAERPNATEDWRRALGLLERSPEWSALDAFEARRGRLRELLDLPAPEAMPGPPTWLEAYAAALTAETTDADRASLLYAQVLEEQPASLWARYRRSVMDSRMSKHGDAATKLAECLTLRPRNPTLWTLRAACMVVDARASEALPLCERALDLDPDFLDAYIVRCLARAKLGQIDGQREDAARVAALSKSRGRSQSLGLTLSQGKKAEENQVIPTVATEDVTIQALIGEQLHRDGQIEAALAAYDGVLADDPGHLVARYRRAGILRSQRRNEGLNEFAEIIEDPKFPELVRGDPNALGVIHFVAHCRLDSGDVSVARALSERALKMALEIQKPGEPFDGIIAESRYALARAIIQESPDTTTNAIAAAELLWKAGQGKPELLDKRFPVDRFFKSHKDALSREIEQFKKSETTSGAGSSIPPQPDVSHVGAEPVQPR